MPILTSKEYKISEMVILFFVIPIFLALNISIIAKTIIIVFGLSYCIWVSTKLKLITKTTLTEFNLKPHLKRVGLTFLFVIVSSSIFLYFTDPKNLFIVIKENPLMWFFVIIIYSLLSVLPQELLYRSYFFRRYSDSFFPPYVIIFFNILAFPVGHLFFHNNLVLIVTFIGGILFTTTYFKSKSVLLTSIEHAIYGNWLFTIGMGEMLAFPMPS